MIRFLHGHAPQVLSAPPSGIAQCCITSPPYYGLRDYGLPDIGAKHKDLLLTPFRVALALQAAAWHVRMDNIWSKPNPMPESCTDRPTKAHEYVLLLTKQPRYFYDAEAIKEPVSGMAHARGNGLNPTTNGPNSRMMIERAVGRQDSKPNPSASNVRPKHNASFAAACNELVSVRNKRSVWEIATEPYKGPHYATFPQELARICILAGTSAKGCCPQCGAPWTRVVEKGEPDIARQRTCGGDKNGQYHGRATKDFGAHRAQDASATKARLLAGMVERKTVGWKPGCACDMDPVPCTVLDPFAGSGTVAQVCVELARNCIGIDLSDQSQSLLGERTNTTPGLPLS